MKRQSSQSTQVVKREEKETKLTQFVLGEIAAGRVSLEGQWNVLALSMDSPVIAVVRRVVSDLGGAAGLQLRIVLTARGKHTIGAGIAGVGTLVVRASQNTRLLDAHEQLVLGALSSWTGDCMRRNPRERDAFETFAADNAELSQWAMISFERLWDGSLPVRGGVCVAGSLAGAAELDVVPVGDGARPAVLVAATSRH